MPPPKKDEPGYAEYREQYALCDQNLEHLALLCASD